MINSIVSPNSSSFILSQEFQDSVGFVSSMSKIKNIFDTNLNVNISHLYRVQRIYEQCPFLCSYKLEDEFIHFDCLHQICKKTDILSYYPFLLNGIIHFDVQISNNKNIPICNVNPRLLINKFENPIEMNNIKIKPNLFITNKLKIFAVMMIKGFIIVKIDKSQTTILFTLTKPNDDIVGYCLYDQFNMIPVINKIWPLFKLEKKSSNIKLSIQNNILNIKNKHPLLIEISRANNATDVSPRIIGKSVFIK